jgi:hypothetical protein
MYVCRIQMATVEVKDYANLREAWRVYGKSWVVGRYVVADRLTGAQLKRLPKSLRQKLIHGKTASEYHGEQKGIAELERMFGLEDPRSLSCEEQQGGR